MNHLMRPVVNTLAQFLLVLFIVSTIGLSVMPGRIYAVAPTTDLDDTANVTKAVLKVKSTMNDVTQTAQGKQELVKENVLDKIAFTVAKIAADKLRQTTLNWAGGGFKNGKQLYVDSFNDFLAEAGDAALRQGLTELSQSQGWIEGAYDPALEGEATVTLLDTPSWIDEYIMNAMRVDEAGLERLVTSIGISEVTNYCDGNLGFDGAFFRQTDGCFPNGIPPVADQCPRFQNPSNNENRCAMQATTWQWNVALRNGTLVSFTSGGFFGQGNADTDAIPKGDSAIPGNFTAGNPSNIGSFSDGQLNAFGTQLTRTVVRGYQSSITGTIETTLREELGPEWLNFATDITVGYNPLDSYASWELLLETGNNPIGTLYNTANRIAVSADEKLAAATTEVTSSGFLADKVCIEEGSIRFADGTEEETCERFDTQSPGSLVGDTVSESITKAFDVPDNADWATLGVEVLANTASAVITGSLDYAAGEARNWAAEQTAQIRQLGPLTYLFGELATGTTIGDDQAWQLLASRDVDFSDLNDAINVTAYEARISSLTSDVLSDMAVPVMMLDQECVLGPDVGWERRLSENFNEDIERLAERVQEDEADDDGNGDPNDKFLARRQLLRSLEDELQRQIEWTKTAMRSAPFRYQLQFSDQIESSLDNFARRADFREEATAKSNAATTLLQVRDTLLSVPGAEILLQDPPTWQDDPSQIISGISEVASLESRVARNSPRSVSQSSGELINSTQREAIGTVSSLPVIDIQRANITLPSQPVEFNFDVRTGVSAFDKEDGPINTPNISVTIEQIQPDGTLQVIPGNVIDLSQRFVTSPEVLDQNGFLVEPEVTAGIAYNITYSVEDSDGNTAESTRRIRTKTFDEHLEDLGEFNASLSDFLQTIATADLQTRLILSQAVNLYLGIEDEIGNETSTRQIETEYEKAQQLVRDLHVSLDLCWLEWYRLDKLIDPEAYPAINNQEIAEGVTSPINVFSASDLAIAGLNVGAPGRRDAWEALQQSLEEIQPGQSDSRVPYHTRVIPLTNNETRTGELNRLQQGYRVVERNINAFLGDNQWASYLSPALLIYDSLLTDTSDAAKLARYVLRPDHVSATVPDFRCALDDELFDVIERECSNVRACIEEVQQAYENYHCISKAWTRPPDEDPNLVQRFNKSTPNGDPRDRISDRFTYARHNIGIYEGILELPDSLPSVDGWQPVVSDPPCDPLEPQFKSAVLGSPINSCDWWFGTLIHVTPPLLTDPTESPYGAGNALINHGYLKVLEQNNFILPAELRRPPELPDPNNQGQTVPWPNNWPFQPGTMHALRVYEEHTRGTLYCRFNSILFNPIASFNKIQIGAEHIGNSNTYAFWWTGEIAPDSSVVLSKLATDRGERFWSDIQRCDEWTKSDLSTYASYPNLEF